MRWQAVVDLNEAAEAVADILEAWRVMLAWPDAAPFSGGVLDAWPQRLTEGLGEARREWAAVLEYQRWLMRQKQPKGKRRG